MKMLFASDLGFRIYEKYVGDAVVDGMFEEVMPVFEAADFRMANLETPFIHESHTPIVKSGPNIKCPAEFVYALKKLKLDVVGLANNHTGDYGEEGVFYTLDTLRKNGLPYIGAGKNLEEAYEEYVYTKDGVNISILCVCENEYGIARKNFAGCAGYKIGICAKRIMEEKAKGNYVILFFHGGNEDNPYPSPGKQELYRYFTDLGADAVLAMHTHCPQGYEIYNGKPIIYSMGNFFFPSVMAGNRANPQSSFYFGYMTELEFFDGKFIPKFYPYSFYGEKMELLKGERLEKFNKYFDEICKPIHDEDELQKLFNGWCLSLGRTYARHAQYDPAMEHDKILLKNMKNAFTCEAHNELIEAYLTLCYDEGLEAAEPYNKKILEMQVLDI